MVQTTDADQKQRLAAWNKRCGILWLKYFVIVLVPFFNVVSHAQGDNAVCPQLESIRVIHG